LRVLSDFASKSKFPPDRLSDAGFLALGTAIRMHTDDAPATSPGFDRSVATEDGTVAEASPGSTVRAAATVEATSPAPPATDPPATTATVEKGGPAVPLEGEVLGLTRSDRVALLVAAVACLVALTGQWVRLGGWGTEPIEIVRQQPLHAEYRLDANTATWVEWMQIEGIGEVLARRIVEDRETNGPFTSVDELDRVSGIGPKTVEKLRPYVVVPPSSP
jgi:competence protein ComEA